MKKYFVFLIILLCSCSKYKGNKDSLAYDNVEIIFDGYGEYEIEGKLTVPITDSTVVEKLNDLKNKSQPKWFANIKGTEYVIRLIYTDSNTGDQLLIRILKSTNSTATIEYGAGTIFDGKYKNDKLVSYVSSIIKLEDIKQYEGGLSQKEYDKFIK
ncbi:MAG: hypothetical protein ACI9P5_004646 [Saprospiraceae bacterium]|jgi:hypothetical protein